MWEQIKVDILQCTVYFCGCINWVRGFPQRSTLWFAFLASSTAEVIFPMMPFLTLARSGGWNAVNLYQHLLQIPLAHSAQLQLLSPPPPPNRNPQCTLLVFLLPLKWNCWLLTSFSVRKLMSTLSLPSTVCDNSCLRYLRERHAQFAECSIMTENSIRDYRRSIPLPL